MPGSADSRSELFARALDGGASGPAPDDELRRELAMVGLLVTAGRQAGPDAAARERMRRRILAGLAEPATAGSAVSIGRAVVTPIDVVARRRSVAAGLHGRLLVAAAAAMCLLVALSGMSLVLARDALPGDALYGVKRSAESAELGLTFGDEPRGFKHLQFATARVDEIEALAARADGSSSPGDAGRYLTALQAFDTDTAAGSRLLIERATNGGGRELGVLRGWAEQQRQRLDAAGAAMPARAAARADGSQAVLDRVVRRAGELQGRMACLAVTSGARDDIGLLPADGPCVPAPGAPSAPQPGVTEPRLTQSAPRPGVVVGEGPNGGLAPPLEPLDPAVTPTPTQPPGGGGPTSGPTSSSAAPGTAESNITIPLPLPLPLPPIVVPPLLPGLLPGLKIG